MSNHVHVIDIEKIEKIEIISEDSINKLSTLFKMFSDPTRLKILNVLLYKELNVCEISELVKMSHSAVSHQLSTLKLSNLVKSRKKGKQVYYALSDDHISSIIALGLEHIGE